MAEPNKDQVAELSAQLNALETESKSLLAALQWSSTVRNILVLCLLIFIVVFGFLYYRLYQDITKHKWEEFQTILAAQQSEILEPMSKEAFKLVEDVGPDVWTIFQKRIESDGKKYVNAFTNERDILSKNLELHVEDSANKVYEKLLEDHEKILQEEFPQLNTEGNKAKLHTNMTQAYKQLVRRYYIDYFHNEIEKMALAVDKFPVAEPDESKGPLPQQVLYELMEMVQMMMVGPSEDLNLKASREAFATPNNETQQQPPAEAKKDGPASGGGQ